MGQEAKRNIAKGLLLCFGLTFVLVGGLMLYFSRDGIKDVLASNKKAYAVESTKLGDLKPGDRVTVDVRTSVGRVMTVYEMTSQGGNRGSQKDTRYYAIPVFTGDVAEGYDYLVLVAQNNNFSKLDAATKDYLNWLEYNNTTDDFKRRKMEMSYETGKLPEEVLFTVDGRVQKLTNEELGYLKEWFGDENYEEYVQPYVICPLGNDKNMQTTKMLLIMAGGTLVVGIIMLLIGLLRGRKKKAVEVERT